LTQGVGQNLTPQKKDNTKEKEKKDTVGGQILDFGENKNCKLTAEEKEKLLKKMSAQELEYWIEELDIAVGAAGGAKAFRKKYRSNTATHYYTILAWKRKREAEGKPIGKSTGGPEANREHAEYIKENYSVMCQQRSVRIDVGPKYIEFIPIGGQIPSTCVYYADKGFKTQIEHALRKWRLI